MSSLKMTFSLTSLILIIAFGLIFVPAAVMAHDGHDDKHPIVTITEAPASVYTGTDEKERDDYRVKITASFNKSTDIAPFGAGAAKELASSEITVIGYSRNNSQVSATAYNPTTITQPDTNKAEWIVTIDLTDTTSLGPTVRSIRVSVTAGALALAHIDSDEASELTSEDFSSLPVVQSETVGVTVAADTTTAPTNDYIVTFTFSGTSTISPTFDLTQVVVTPASAQTALGLIDPAAPDNTEPNVYTMDVDLTFDVQSVTIGVDPNFAAVTDDEVGSVKIPPVVVTPPTQADPTVSIMVDMLDTATRTFRVDVTSTPGAMSDESKPNAQAVTHANLEVKDADGMAIETSEQEMDTVTNPTTNVSRYVAVLKYGLASNAPATVGLKATFKTANTVAPATFGMDDSGNGGDGDTNTPPVFADDTAIRSVVENTAGGTNIGAPITATDADDGDTLTYSLSGQHADAFDIESATGQLKTDVALDYETKRSYAVTVTADDGNGGTDTINVLIGVTNDPSDDPPDPVITLTLNDVIKVQGIHLRSSGDYTVDAEVGPGTGSIIVGTLTSTTNINPWDVFNRRHHEIRSTFHSTGNQNEWNWVIDITGLSDWVELDPYQGYDLVLSDNPDTDVSDDSIELRYLRIYVDRLGPVITDVTHVALPADGGPVTVNIHFNEPLASTPTPANFGVKNGTISDIRLVTTRQYVATITPAHGVGPGKANTAVEIRLNAGVMDEHGNASVATAATAAADGMFSPRKATMADDGMDDDTAPTSSENMLSGLSVAAESFVVLVRNANVKGLPDSLPAKASKVLWADMPDLEDLLYGGGSINLTRAKTPQLDHDAKTDTATRDAAARDLIITEVMWAKNTALTGKNGELDHQWIEIYNPLKDAIGGVTLKTIKGRTPITVAGTDVLLDRLSNQVGGGWALAGLGQNGSDDMNDDTNDTKVDFISMFRTERGKDGHTKGHWAQSTEIAITGHKATPGRLERKAAVVIKATDVPRTPFVINEFGIGTNDGEDWVELRNVTDGVASLNNLLLTSVTEVDKEEIEFHFHDKDLKVPAGGVVLIVSTHPEETDIAGGINLEIAEDDQVKKGLEHIYVVRNFELPTGKFNLILRKDYDDEKTGDFLPGKKLDKVVDAIGSLKVDKDTADFNTDFWPLNGTDKPHDDVIEGLGQDFKAGTVYIRKNAGGGIGEHHLGKAGYTGIGYDRTAVKSDANAGTPGYANDASKDKIAGLTTGEITISEIMLDTGERGQNLPQWIELYNSSMTQAVNLDGWKLHIENASGGPPIHAKDLPEELNTYNATLTFASKSILPNQTVLIVSNAASGGKISHRDDFPSTRVINLWTTKAHREALLREKRTDQVISKRGFSLTLVDKDGIVADQAGNLDGNRRTRDEPEWELPKGKDDGRRSSLIRVYGKTGQGALRMSYDHGEAIPGTMRDAWVSAVLTGFANVTAHTYYGDSDDLGTPGIRGGGPLPVSLSKFRPERMKDTGEIVIRWATESELNNAGFNILRSEKRDGEFTKVHFEAGQGTTSERSAYEWRDKSAKPNVVYYYQIQDVSLDGEVTTLRTTHLRGNVTAVGKATTTWGEIKALQ